MRNSYMRREILLLLFSGIFLGCESSGVRKSSSMADDLGGVSIEDVLSDEDFLIEYEDIYMDSTTVVQQKKYWQGYRTFVSRLKKTPVMLSDLANGKSLVSGESVSIDSENLLESVFGKKKWVLLTPALWNDSSSTVSIDSFPHKVVSLSSQIGDAFINITGGGESLPNGKASLGQFFLDLGQQDVYVDILLAMNSGYITEFERKSDQIFSPWSDSPLPKSAVTNIFSNKEKLKEHALYLVLSFPLHKTKPYDVLSGENLDFVKTYQDGIRKYIWDGKQFQFPFGTSLNTIFSKRISRNSVNNSQGSYMGRSMYSLGMQILLTQYQFVSTSVFSQMLWSVFDGVSSKNQSSAAIIPPGYFTQSIAYNSDDGQDLHATCNTVVMVPFLIDKVLEDRETGKQGLLLKGNPLAIRTISIQSPMDLTHFSPDLIAKQSSLQEIDVVSRFNHSFSKNLSFQKRDTPNLKKEIKILGDSAQKIGMMDDVIQNVLTILGKSENTILQEQVVPTGTVLNIPQELSNKGVVFSWEELKKFFANDESRKTLLRAQKSQSDSIVWKGLGITAYENMKDHNVGALLQYAGFDLIFWPEDGVDFVRNKLQQDFQN